MECASYKCNWCRRNLADSERRTCKGYLRRIYLSCFFGGTDFERHAIIKGVFGFSQGAACAALLSALVWCTSVHSLTFSLIEISQLERPHLHEPFLIDGKAPHPPM